MQFGSQQKFNLNVEDLFPITHEGCEEWFVDYLKELGFSNSGRAMTKDVEKLWRDNEQGYRTDDKRLVIRDAAKTPGVGVTIPNFVNTIVNFQIYWEDYALKNARSNINILSYDHFFELITFPSRDYHDPLKVQEIFAPTAFNNIG